MNHDDEDEYSPHLNTSEDPYLARRSDAVEAERTRQLAALEHLIHGEAQSPRARALARARRTTNMEGTGQ